MKAYTILSLPILISTAAGAIPSASTNLEIYALPVGQGDCTVIQCPAGQLILNDCGSRRGAGYTKQQVRDFFGDRVNDIAAIFISHAHEDHYNYLSTITDSTNMNIQSVIIGGGVSDYSETFQNWLIDFGRRLLLISNGNGCIGNCTISGGTNFCNNININFSVLAANVGPSKNERSIVLKVTNNQFSVLLPGDMEGNAATKIANDPSVSTQLQSVVYKMAHHGASTKANMRVWLQAIQPMRAFASSAYDFGNCNHPRCDTIMRLQALDTIQPAPPHDFYCGVPLTTYTNFAENMYETSPTANMICLLTYTSAGTFNQSCMPPSQTQRGTRDAAFEVMPDESDECGADPQDQVEAIGGATHFYAGFPVILMEGLLLPFLAGVA